MCTNFEGEKIDDIEGTVQKYVAPAGGARSGLGGAEIRIGTPGKRATTGRERGAPVRKARILIDFGIVLNVYFIAMRTPAIDFSTKIVHDF